MSEEKRKITAWPLYWPGGKPRTPIADRKINRAFQTSFATARDRCIREVLRMGGSDIVISTNVPLRRDGVPQAQDWNQPLKTDNGVAVYFKRKGQELCFACDSWTHVQDNMHAICLTIEALRGIARWGTGDMMEAAFRGFRSLPAPGESSALQWWKVLGVPINSSPENVKEAYRLLVNKHHPDRKGDPELFLRVQAAWDQFNELQPKEAA